SFFPSSRPRAACAAGSRYVALSSARFRTAPLAAPAPRAPFRRVGGVALSAGWGTVPWGGTYVSVARHASGRMRAVALQGIQGGQSSCAVSSGGNMSEWMSDLQGDCPKRDAPQLHGRCDLICSDLSNVL